MVCSSEEEWELVDAYLLPQKVQKTEDLLQISTNSKKITKKASLNSLIFKIEILCIVHFLSKILINKCYIYNRLERVGD